MIQRKALEVKIDKLCSLIEKLIDMFEPEDSDELDPDSILRRKERDLIRTEIDKQNKFFN